MKFFHTYKPLDVTETTFTANWTGLDGNELQVQVSRLVFLHSYKLRSHSRKMFSGFFFPTVTFFSVYSNHSTLFNLWISPHGTRSLSSMGASLLRTLPFFYIIFVFGRVHPGMGLK
jgi:hypothetical protein